MLPAVLPDQPLHNDIISQLLVFLMSCLSAMFVCWCTAVMFLRVVICPLAAVYFLKLLKHAEVPYVHKVPTAPLSTIFEMVIKFVTTKLDL